MITTSKRVPIVRPPHQSTISGLYGNRMNINSFGRGLNDSLAKLMNFNLNDAGSVIDSAKKLVKLMTNYTDSFNDAKLKSSYLYETAYSKHYADNPSLPKVKKEPITIQSYTTGTFGIDIVSSSVTPKSQNLSDLKPTLSYRVNTVSAKDDKFLEVKLNAKGQIIEVYAHNGDAWYRVDLQEKTKSAELIYREAPDRIDDRHQARFLARQLAMA